MYELDPASKWSLILTLKNKLRAGLNCRILDESSFVVASEDKLVLVNLALKIETCLANDYLADLFTFDQLICYQNARKQLVAYDPVNHQAHQIKAYNAYNGN